VKTFVRRCALAAITVATFAVAGTAQADIVAPNAPREACAGKAEGDACSKDAISGACKKTTCSRKVGGVLNPSFVDEECLLCDATLTPTKAEAPTPTPAKTEPAKPEPAKPEAAKPEPVKPEAEKSSICSVSTDATPLASTAFGLMLVVLARRRRPTMRA